MKVARGTEFLFISRFRRLQHCWRFWARDTSPLATRPRGRCCLVAKLYSVARTRLRLNCYPHLIIGEFSFLFVRLFNALTSSFILIYQQNTDFNVLNYWQVIICISVLRAYVVCITLGNYYFIFSWFMTDYVVCVFLDHDCSVSCWVLITLSIPPWFKMTLAVYSLYS